MNTATIVMVALAVLLLLIASFQGSALAGLRIAGRTLLQVLPMLLAAFVIAGLIQALVPGEIISRWLGKGAGIKGILIGSLAGGLTPGGPAISFPLAASIWKSGASIGVVVAYVTAWALWSLPRLPYEIGLVSAKFALIRFLSTLIFPPLAGLIAQSIFSRFAQAPVV